MIYLFYSCFPLLLIDKLIKSFSYCNLSVICSQINSLYERACSWVGWCNTWENIKNAKKLVVDRLQCRWYLWIMRCSLNCELTEVLVVKVELPLLFQMQTFLPQHIIKTPSSGHGLVPLTLYKGKLKKKKKKNTQKKKKKVLFKKKKI